MPKKVKLKLDDLKVQSFVTLLNKDHAYKLMGGETDNCTEGAGCRLQKDPCPPEGNQNTWCGEGCEDPPIETQVETACWFGEPLC
jgi:hypothetical protein